MSLFGSKIWNGELPIGKEVEIEGTDRKGIVHSDGLLLCDGNGCGVSLIVFNILYVVQIFNILKTNWPPTRIRSLVVYPGANVHILLA